MRRLARHAFFLVIAVAAAWSCVLYDTSMLLPAPAVNPVPDAVGGDADGGCALARWPDRPLVDDVPGGGGIEFVAALRSIDYGVGRDAGVPRDFGFDLDNRCTCPADDGGASCRPFADAEPMCDFDNGRDNTAAVILDAFTKFSDSFNQTAVNESLANGFYGLLVRVRRYNGTPNDPNVEVAIFNSPGHDGVQDGGVPTKPRNDGTDRWTVDPGSLKGGIGPPYTPVYVDPNAYVANNRLVATLDFPITFAGQPLEKVTALTVDLKGSVVVGTLVREGDGYRIDDGRLGGRWPTARLLTSLEVLPDPANLDAGAGLCGDSGTYAFIKGLVCDRQDIVTDLRQDNTSAPCDAVSLSVAFTAGPARLGDVVAPPTAPRLCGPTWSDDCAR